MAAENTDKNKLRRDATGNVATVLLLPLLRRGLKKGHIDAF